MSDDPCPMVKIEVEFPARWLPRFKAVHYPDWICGPGIEEIVAHWIEEKLETFERSAELEAQAKLYHSFGLKAPTDYDEEDDAPDL